MNRNGSPHPPVFLLLLPLIALLAGCDGFSSRPDPPATDIQEIRVEPNPVVQGEQTTFTVVTPDTAETGFTYLWTAPSPNAETKVPRYTWTASVPPDEYQFAIHIRRKGPYESVQRTFKVTVLPKP